MRRRCDFYLAFIIILGYFPWGSYSQPELQYKECMFKGAANGATIIDNVPLVDLKIVVVSGGGELLHGDTIATNSVGKARIPYSDDDNWKQAKLEFEYMKKKYDPVLLKNLLNMKECIHYIPGIIQKKNGVAVEHESDEKVRINLRRNIKELLKLLEEEKRIREMLKSKVDKLVDENDALRNELDSYTTRLLEIESEKNVLKKEINILKTQINVLDEELLKKEKELMSKEEENAKLKREIEEVKRKLDCEKISNLINRLPIVEEFDWQPIYERKNVTKETISLIEWHRIRVILKTKDLESLNSKLYYIKITVKEEKGNKIVITDKSRERNPEIPIQLIPHPFNPQGAPSKEGTGSTEVPIDAPDFKGKEIVKITISVFYKTDIPNLISDPMLCEGYYQINPDVKEIILNTYKQKLNGRRDFFDQYYNPCK